MSIWNRVTHRRPAHTERGLRAPQDVRDQSSSSRRNLSQGSHLGRAEHRSPPVLRPSDDAQDDDGRHENHDPTANPKPARAHQPHRRRPQASFSKFSRTSTSAGGQVFASHFVSASRVFTDFTLLRLTTASHGPDHAIGRGHARTAWCAPCALRPTGVGGSLSLS